MKHPTSQSDVFYNPPILLYLSANQFWGFFFTILTHVANASTLAVNAASIVGTSTSTLDLEQILLC